MDSLTDEEKQLAWEAGWHPSFDGIAIVNRDFSFRDVNPQWCELLEQLPSEFLDKSFEDITPVDVRNLDSDNANLVMEGRIPSYVINKSYHFSDGKKKNIILLVCRVPKDTNKPFRFFLSRILLNEPVSKSEQKYLTESLLSFWKEYGKTIIGIGAGIGAAIVAVLQYLKSI